jgi:uncharacterized protein CbrC (UPF0167 family)
MNVANAFGLLKEGWTMSLVKPQKQDLLLCSPKTERLAGSLDELIQEHLHDLAPSGDDGTGDKVSFEKHSLPNPQIWGDGTITTVFPLLEVWRKWWESRSASELETDGNDLERLLVALKSPLAWSSGHNYVPAICDGLELIFGIRDTLDIDHGPHAAKIVTWLLFLYKTERRADFLLNAAEHSLAIGNSEMGKEWVAWLRHATEVLLPWGSNATKKHLTQLWELMKWADAQNLWFTKMPIHQVLQMHDIGVASREELLWYLVGEPSVRKSNPWSGPFGDLSIALRFYDQSGRETCGALVECVNHISHVTLTSQDAKGRLMEAFKECTFCFGSNLLLLAAQVHGGLAKGSSVVAKKIVERSRPLSETEVGTFSSRLESLGVPAATRTFVIRQAKHWSGAFEVSSADDRADGVPSALSLHYFQAPASALSGYVEVGTCSLCGEVSDAAITLPAAFLQREIVRIINVDGRGESRELEKSGEWIACCACIQAGSLEFRHTTEQGIVGSLQDLARLFPKIAVEKGREFLSTPDFRANQEPLWLTHCDDFMDFIGVWQREDLESEAGRQKLKPNVLFNRIAVKTDVDDERPSWSKWDLGQEFYVFQCRHCKAKRGYLQAD